MLEMESIVFPFFLFTGQCQSIFGQLKTSIFVLLLGVFFFFFSEHKSVYTLLHSLAHICVRMHSHEVKLFARQEVWNTSE